MTANLTITDTELQAIRSAERYLALIAHEDAFRPSHEVQADLATVNRMLSRLATAPPIEEVASIPDENDYGLGRDHSDGGKDGPDINWRWAKETVGLAALELNEAYKQFVVSDEGWETPNGLLHRAAKRLNEAMERVGNADPAREIHF